MEMLTQPWTIELDLIMEMERRVVEVLTRHRTKDEAITSFIVNNRKPFLKHLLMRSDTTLQQRELIEAYFMMRKMEGK